MAGDTTGESLEHRESAMGESFYQGDADEVRQHMALRKEEEAARGLIAEATGITDPEVLAELAGLGIRVETLAALTLIPLIHVAWADGVMDEAERAAILDAAEATGSAPGSLSYRLLEIWTLEEPPPDLTNAWRAFIRALSVQLKDDEASRLRANLLGRARDVARSAGSALNRAPHISPEEESCIAFLAEAFAS